jgi:hypothetical protein
VAATQGPGEVVMNQDPQLAGPPPGPPVTHLPAPGARTRRRRIIAATVTLLVVVLAALLLLRSCADEQPQSVTVVAAGDMGCDPKDPGTGTALRCQAQAVSDIAVGLEPYAFIGLGDYQYEIPTTTGYDTVYAPSWGRLRDITYPALGNQEYKVHEANTFRTYFGERAGPEQGYWSVQLGQWHVVFLNSNCTVVTGGCAADSPQHRWLEQHLADTSARCTMAVWHHPRWSNGIAGSDARTSALYETLLVNDVDILLSGHEADYERFGPLDGSGQSIDVGVRQFVAGTGGQVTYDPQEGDAQWRAKADPVPNEFLDTEHHGVLQLTLNPDSYSWQFFALGEGVVDSGSATCH